MYHGDTEALRKNLKGMLLQMDTDGFILLLHIGSGPGRADKFHTRFGQLLDTLAGGGYWFSRVDELLNPREPGNEDEHTKTN